MKWIAAKVVFDSPEIDLAADLVADIFYSLGLKGVVVNDPQIDPQPDWAEDAVREAGLDPTLVARTAESTEGNPLLRVGTTLELDGTGGRFDNTYRVTLTGSAMDFLHEHYGARLERLRTLNSREGLQPATLKNTALARSPLSMDKDVRWKKTLDQASSLLKRHEQARGAQE